MIVFFSPQKTAASKHNALSRVASLKPNSSVNFNLRVYSFCLWCHHNFCVSERHIPTCWSKCVFSGSKSKIVKRKTGTVVGEHNVLLRLSKQPKTLWNIPDHMTSQSAIVHIVLYLVCLSFRMQLLYRCFFLIQVHIHRSVFLMISMTRYSIIPSNLTFLCTITASSKLANSVYHSEKHPGPEGDHHRHNHHLLCILVPLTADAQTYKWKGYFFRAKERKIGNCRGLWSFGFSSSRSSSMSVSFLFNESPRFTGPKLLSCCWDAEPDPSVLEFQTCMSSSSISSMSAPLQHFFLPLPPLLFYKKILKQEGLKQRRFNPSASHLFPPLSASSSQTG